MLGLRGLLSSGGFWGGFHAVCSERDDMSRTQAVGRVQEESPDLFFCGLGDVTPAAMQKRTNLPQAGEGAFHVRARFEVGARSRYSLGPTCEVGDARGAGRRDGCDEGRAADPSGRPSLEICMRVGAVRVLAREGGPLDGDWMGIDCDIIAVTSIRRSSEVRRLKDDKRKPSRCSRQWRWNGYNVCLCCLLPLGLTAMNEGCCVGNGLSVSVVRKHVQREDNISRIVLGKRPNGGQTATVTWPVAAALPWQ